jgi:hypothetical protein
MNLYFCFLFNFFEELGLNPLGFAGDHEEETKRKELFEKLNLGVFSSEYIVRGKFNKKVPFILCFESSDIIGGSIDFRGIDVNSEEEITSKFLEIGIEIERDSSLFGHFDLTFLQIRMGVPALREEEKKRNKIKQRMNEIECANRIYY